MICTESRCQKTESWCQKVLDLLDLLFAELLGPTWLDGYFSTFSVHFSNFPLFLSYEGGNKWIIVDFYGICKISPEDLPKPS